MEMVMFLRLFRGFREVEQKYPKFPHPAAVFGSHFPETPIEPNINAPDK
jgi:hypothetical protein